MTDEELAQRFKDDLTELHTKIATKPDGPQKRRFERRADAAHLLLSAIAKEVFDAETVATFSIGDKDEPDEPG